MESTRRNCTLASLLALAALPALVLVLGSSGRAAGQAPPAGQHVKLAGVRSSAYGIKPFPTPEGWGKAMKTMAEHFPGSTPFGIWIVGRLNGKTTGVSLEFPRPSDGVEYGPLYTFSEEDKHEPYLKYFDANGIKVFLQVEPGFSDEKTLIDVVLNRYKQHASVIGWGIDVEWYQNAKTGNPNAIATDEVVKAWDAKVKSHNPKYRLFVKHFRNSNLPPTYRGDVVFSCNSQNFKDLDGFLARFKNFADFFYPNMVVFQIGYPRDKPWWSTLDTPIPKTLGDKLASVVRQDCGLAWVDFGMRDVLPVE